MRDQADIFYPQITTGTTTGTASRSKNPLITFIYQTDLIKTAIFIRNKCRSSRFTWNQTCGSIRCMNQCWSIAFGSHDRNKSAMRNCEMWKKCSSFIIFLFFSQSDRMAFVGSTATRRQKSRGCNKWESCCPHTHTHTLVNCGFNKLTFDVLLTHWQRSASNKFELTSAILALYVAALVTSSHRRHSTFVEMMGKGCASHYRLQ